MDGDSGRNAGDAATGVAGQSLIEAPPPPPPRRPRARFAIFALVLVAAAVAGGLYWGHARHFETTDDAFIDGDVAVVAPRVSGQVLRVLVTDNQPVHAGDRLVELDPRDLRIKLSQAEAQRANASAQLEEMAARALMQQASVDQASADARVSEADLGQARQDFDRYRKINPQAITRQQLDQATATLRSAEARLDAKRQAVSAAQAQAKSAQAQILGAQASLREAEVAVANAELQLSYATVTAPMNGRVTKRNAVAGNYVTPGSVLLSLVPETLWVTANFKETQLARMRQGQPVDIVIDAIPDTVFHGHVDSFQSGTGSAFATLPPENATGNYVKVVQRVPVKIVFDGPAPDIAGGAPPLAPGMSVTPSVTVR